LLLLITRNAAIMTANGSGRSFKVTRSKTQAPYLSLCKHVAVMRLL
jgi:hypothetical protein